MRKFTVSGSIRHLDGRVVVTVKLSDDTFKRATIPVEQDGECRIWKGTLRNGYPYFTVGMLRYL